jgi:hypothetical protein
VETVGKDGNSSFQKFCACISFEIIWNYVQLHVSNNSEERYRMCVEDMGLWR